MEEIEEERRQNGGGIDAKNHNVQRSKQSPFDFDNDERNC